VVGVNVDSFLLTSSEPDASGVKNQTWAVDNAKSQWWSKLSRTLRWSGEPASKSRKPKDSDVEAVISSASGLIVTPQDRKVGTWWNYRYIQGLNLGTPIVTDWQDTHSFSSSWSKLAYQIEDMDPYDRYALARRQLSEYTNAVPTRWDSSSALRNDLLESNKERANYARD
jgi:hypothetical protein